MNGLKTSVFQLANQDKFIASRAWKKAWNDLSAEGWGNAEEWTEYQKDSIVEQANKYIPNNFTNENVIDRIKSVFDVEDVSHKLKETKEYGVQD